MPSLYHKRNHTAKADPFVDLLFNTLLGFSFLFLISLLFINPEADLAKVDKQAEYVISATWPKDISDDIDLWVNAPSGHTVSYLQKESGWLHLDRDDRGLINDTIFVDGKELVHSVNQEIVTIRNRQVGEYVVNLYYYTSDTPPPIPVQVKVDRINPTFETVFVKTVQLTALDQELTVVRFSIDSSGAALNFNDLPVKLTPYGLEHIPTDVWN